MVSAKFVTFGRSYAYGVFTYGDGIGRYRGGMTAVPDETGQLHAVGGTAFMGGYEHFWATRWSTNAVYSVGRYVGRRLLHVRRQQAARPTAR